jgi:hypothetical protein
MIATVQPAAFAIVDRASCRHCGMAIEMRRVIGWVHTQRFYLCAVQPDDDTYNCAEPAQQPAARQ